MRCMLPMRHKLPHCWKNPLRTRRKKKTNIDPIRRKTNIDPTNQIYKTFKKSARVLGEVEAGLSALFDLLARSGLMRAPADMVTLMEEEQAAEVLQQARQITDLLSHEAKSMIPVLLVAVGDPSALRQFGLQARAQPDDDTVH